MENPLFGKYIDKLQIFKREIRTKAMKQQGLAKKVAKSPARNRNQLLETISTLGDQPGSGKKSTGRLNDGPVEGENPAGYMQVLTDYFD